LIDRYSDPEMAAIWSDESRFSRWLEIEILAIEARVASGAVPPGDLELVRAGARFDPARISEIEKETRHDVVAFLTCVSEGLGPESRHIHYGMTSSDILDTALAMQVRDSARLISARLSACDDALRSLVERTRGIACIGRTHGMHAEPVTLALKFAGLLAELRRAASRFAAATEGACVGKLSGAVGTYAHLDPSIEEYVMKRLGLGREDVATQVVARDRHAAFLFALASIGGALERFATEVRHLQRTEVGEVEESFGQGQKGSSAMPHKRNPVQSERLCGLARLLRGYLLVGLEDSVLWHERDISHSSVERVIGPDATIVLDFMLARMKGIIDGLVVYPENMVRNMNLTRGLWHSQNVLLALVDAGVQRDEAYAWVQRNALKVWDSDADFRDLLTGDREIVSVLGKEAIENLFDLSHHLAHVNTIFERVFDGKD